MKVRITFLLLMILVVTAELCVLEMFRHKAQQIKCQTDSNEFIDKALRTPGTRLIESGNNCEGN